eukprot:PhM_4_TR8764/c0_g1_i3/m.37077
MLSRSSSGGGGGQNSFSQSSSLGRSFVPILGSQRAHSLLLVQQRAAEARDPYTALLMCFFTPTLEDSVKSDAVATLCNELKIDKASAVFNSYPVRPGRSPQPGQNLNNSTDLDIIYVPRMEDSYVAAPNEIAFAPFRSVHRVLGSWVFVLFSIPFMVGTTLATTIVRIFGESFDSAQYVLPLCGFVAMICQLLRYNRSLVLHSLAKFNTWFYGITLILIHMVQLFSGSKPSIAMATVPYGITQACFNHFIDAAPYPLYGKVAINAFFAAVVLFGVIRGLAAIAYFPTAQMTESREMHRSNFFINTSIQSVVIVLGALQVLFVGVFPLSRRFIWKSHLLHWTTDVHSIFLSDKIHRDGGECHFLSLISPESKKDVKTAANAFVRQMGARHLDECIFTIASKKHRVITHRSEDGFMRASMAPLVQYFRLCGIITNTDALHRLALNRTWTYSLYSLSFALYVLFHFLSLAADVVNCSMPFYVIESLGLILATLLVLNIRPSVFMHLPKHSDFLVATAAFVFLEAARLHGQSTRYNIAPGFVGVVCVVSCVLRWVVWLGVDALPLGHKSRRAVYVGAAATYLVTVITHLTGVIEACTSDTTFVDFVRLDGLFDTSLQSIVVSCGIVLFLYSVRSGVRAHRGCEAYMRYIGREINVELFTDDGFDNRVLSKEEI